MQTSHFLSHSGEETLGIEKPRDPEHLGSAVITPALELSVPLQQLCVPEAQGGGQPGQFLPVPWNPGVVHGVEAGLQALTHDDRPLYGQLEVGERLPDQTEDLLHPRDLLSEENVHRQRPAQSDHGLLHFMPGVVFGKFSQHVVSQLVHHCLPRLSRLPATALFRLNVENLVQDSFSRVDLVADVGVLVKSEHLRTVCERHVLYEVVVLLHIASLGHRVAVVELVGGQDEGLGEPDVGEGVQQPLVKVVCDPAAVLDLAQHELHGGPGDSPPRVQVVKVVDDELGARLEVRAVELVGDVPAEGPELPPLLHDGVEESHGVEEGGPGLVAGVVQVVLGDVRVKSLQTRPDPLGRLVGVLR